MKHKIKSLLLLSVIFTILTACILPQGLIPVNLGQATAPPVQPQLDFVTPDITNTEVPAATGTSTSTLMPATMTVAMPEATPEPVASSVWVANWMDGNINPLRWQDPDRRSQHCSRRPANANYGAAGCRLGSLTPPRTRSCVSTPQTIRWKLSSPSTRWKYKPSPLAKALCGLGVREAVEEPAEGEEADPDVNLKWRRCAHQP